MRSRFPVRRCVVSRVSLTCYALGLLSAVSAAAGDLRWDLHLDGSLMSTVYPHVLSQTNSVLETARLSTPFEAREGAFRLKLDPLFQADPLNNSSSERYWVDLPEGYVRWQKSGWSIQAGYDTVTWGVTDGFNPLDVVSARRLQDALTPDKLGAPMLSVKKGVGIFAWEGLYVPRQRSGILPGENSRWLPRDILTSRSAEYNGTPVTVLLPENPSYSYASDQEVDHATENNFGTRLQAQGLLPGLDASLEVYDGSAATPAVDTFVKGNVTSLSPTVVIQAQPGIQLTPIEYRELAYGGSLVYAGFGLIVRFETSITRMISQRADLPGDSEQYVLEVEHTFPIGPQGLTTLIEAAYGQHALPADNSAASIDRIFDRAAILGARYSFSEKLAVTGSALWDTEFHTELLQLEASYALTDAFKLKLAGLDLWGSPATPLGAYAENARAQLGLQLSL